MDGVAGCLSGCSINDGGFLYHCFACIFPTAKRKQPPTAPGPKRKNDPHGWMNPLRNAKAGQYPQVAQERPAAVLFALPFSAQSSSAWGGVLAPLLRGSRVWSPNTSFNLTLSLGRITISPWISGVCPNNFPLDGIRISVIFSSRLGHRILQAQRSAV